MRRAARARGLGKNAAVTFYPSPSVVPAGDPTAVVGKRIGAAIIDVLIGVAAAALMFAVNHDTIDRNVLGFDLSCDTAGNNLCFTSGDKIYYAEDSKAAAIYGVAILVGFANHVLLQGATGASIGKKVFGLRVIKKD